MDKKPNRAPRGDETFLGRGIEYCRFGVDGSGGMQTNGTTRGRTAPSPVHQILNGGQRKAGWSLAGYLENCETRRETREDKKKIGARGRTSDFVSACARTGEMHREGVAPWDVFWYGGGGRRRIDGGLTSGGRVGQMRVSARRAMGNGAQTGWGSKGGTKAKRRQAAK
ncbi:hypothetical protein K438DRAFT_1787266 [Mycena galopus ATCC 62051]|nr:hypothetical protein K438DRAFT_1791208 [Mycena galopus ATCC 62051]KAF8134167.1 hypothetical protein K438DRAFT_1787266 [Mycena galopus ATCC 62051]